MWDKIFHYKAHTCKSTYTHTQKGNKNLKFLNIVLLLETVNNSFNLPYMLILQSLKRLQYYHSFLIIVIPSCEIMYIKHPEKCVMMQKSLSF